MLKLTKEDMLDIERVMYNKARDIDVSIYNAIIDDECKDFVLDSLMLYMTKDGGIGNALEIDNYNPNSSVYQTYEALRILSALDFNEDNDSELYSLLLNKIGNYLFNRCPIEDGFWNPLTPTNDNFAHSEKYNYTANPFPTWRVHPTAAILGFILELMPENKAYYKKALKQIGYVFAKLDDDKKWNEYEFISYSSLLKSLKKTKIFEEESKRIEERLLAEAKDHLDEPDFNFPLYLMDIEVDNILEEKINQYLDNLINSRASYGLWEHRGSWLSNRYPEADSAMLKWIGADGAWNIYLLNKYGRIEK